ncbi:MAG: molybdopterin-dependent oxidoreductase [Desulfohalobiaceae bacterium]|nr:molybdopterin-dependent oxidoreductase [Desulfohalobiaceae bacterium]
MQDTQIIKTTTWSPGPGCHGNCGVLAHVKDGRLVKVEGDPEHPWSQGRLCPRVLSMTQYAYHPDRLTKPLKRVGERGEGRWEEISWEEAFDLLEQKLGRIKEEYGPESVLFIQGTGRDIGGWIRLLAHSYGSPNVVYGLSGVACYTPRLMSMWLTQGDFCVQDAAQWLPERYEHPSYEVPECIIVWGQTIQATCPDGFFAHWIVDLMKKGTQIMVIDPRYSWFAARSKHWLQIRPGTDGALAMGFLNVILNEELYDTEFVEKWTNAPFLVRSDRNELLRESDLKSEGDSAKLVAWDSYTQDLCIWDPDRAQYAPSTAKPELEGRFEVTLKEGSSVQCHTVWSALKQRAGEYTPDRVSETTWIPPEKIKECARFYAKSKPAGIHWGLPIDTVPGTTYVGQAISHLWCVTGNLDVPGSNVIARYPFDVITYPYYSKGSGLVSLSAEQQQKRIGTWKYKAMRDFRDWGHPDTALEQIFTEDPYPIKGAWIQTSNPIAGLGMDPKKWHEALKKLDFVAVTDLFLTPTAMIADLVLPAATFLEKDSLKGWWVPLQSINKAISVPECKSDIEINLELAKRFRPDLPWSNVQEMFDDLLKPSGLTYQELRDKEWVMPPAGHPTAPYRRYEQGLLRQNQKPGFTTPSGKIELHSSWLEYWGLDPMPHHEEPPYSPVSTPELYDQYPLILTTGRRRSVYFHAEHRMIPWLREQEPDPLVEIHPDTAESLGIKEGDWVVIENWLGRCKQKARLTPVIHSDVVMAAHGWWFPEKAGEEPSLFGVWDVNINQLIPMGCNGQTGHGSPLKNMLCKIYKETDHV